MKRISFGTYGYLLLIWLIITLLNSNKAFHIDDTFHLEAAQYILENPTKPMSGVINWSGGELPMYERNQPPLWFYGISLVISVFGYSEVWLHLFVSLFAFLALYFFKKLYEFYEGKHIRIALICFGFNPAFIVNQNVMIDIPLLSMMLGFVYFLCLNDQRENIRCYLYSIGFFTVGFFLKYTIVPLIFVFFVVLLIRKHYRSLFLLLIPLSMILIWHYWNQWEFGKSHLFDRNSSIKLTQSYAFFSGLGAIATFFILISENFKPFRKIKVFIRVLFLALPALAFFVYLDWIDEALTQRLMDLVFFLVGSLLVVGLLLHHKKRFLKVADFLKEKEGVLFLTLCTLVFFIVFFAPFMATRHILLIIPILLILFRDAFLVKNKFQKGLVSFIVLLGVLIGVSDWQSANYYRDMSQSTEIQSNSIKWSLGHWGWQWYASKEGMKVYNKETSRLGVGDYIIYPNNIDKQKLEDGVVLKLIDKKWKEPNFLTFLSVADANMYTNRYTKPAWTFSKKPIDTIFIFQVEKVSDLK